VKQSPPLTKKPFERILRDMSLTDSKFNMWRTITSLAHADGIFCRDEKNYLEPIFDGLDLSSEQREQLKSDMITPQDSKKMFELISEPADRAQVTYFGRILMWADENLESSEEEMLKKLTDLAMSKTDFKAVMKKVHQVAQDFKNEEELRRESRPTHRKILDAIVFWEDLP